MVSNLARKPHTGSKIIISGVIVKLDGGPFFIPGEQIKIGGKNRFVAPSEGASFGEAELIYILEQFNNKTCVGTEDLGQASTRHESESPARKAGAKAMSADDLKKMVKGLAPTSCDLVPTR